MWLARHGTERRKYEIPKAPERVIAGQDRVECSSVPFYLVLHLFLVFLVHFVRPDKHLELKHKKILDCTQTSLLVWIATLFLCFSPPLNSASPPLQLFHHLQVHKEESIEWESYTDLVYLRLQLSLQFLVFPAEIRPLVQLPQCRFNTLELPRGFDRTVFAIVSPHARIICARGMTSRCRVAHHAGHSGNIIIITIIIIIIIMIFKQVCSVRWPKSVTAKAKASRQNKESHGKIKNLTAK